MSLRRINSRRVEAHQITDEVVGIDVSEATPTINDDKSHQAITFEFIDAFYFAMLPRMQREEP